MLRYRPELDGLRALSVLVVVVYHFPIKPWLPGGFIGVDMFFVLSGALITLLLLAEEERTGTVALATFYWRRMRRLYPALLAMCLTIATVSAFTFPRDILGETLHDAGLSAVYLGALLPLDKHVRFFGHTWTLSVEEAFYLGWPLALIALRRAGTRARVLCAALVVVACAGRTLELWFFDMVLPQRIWVGLDTRMGVIALGCIVGLAAHNGVLDRFRRVLMWIAPAALIGLLLLTRFADRRTAWYVVLGYPATAALAAVVVARLLVAPSKFFAFSPLVWIGKLSYSIYLWHLPILTLGDHLGWPIPVSLAVALAASCASYYGIESRLRARPLAGSAN